MTNGLKAAMWAEGQIGTRYEDMDCIGLVVNAIRKADGASGESLTYRCGGTNELWRSIGKSGKYRYVTERVAIEEAAQRGMLTPGRLLVIHTDGHNAKYGDDEGDCSHIGIYRGAPDCEVVHSSATRGCVCASTIRNGWTHALVHRLIDCEGTGDWEGDEAEPPEAEQSDGYRAMVTTEKDPLNLRDAPGGKIIAKMPRGCLVTVLSTPDADGWVRVQFATSQATHTGYASVDYLERIYAHPPDDEKSDEPDEWAENLDDVSVPRDIVLGLADAVNAVKAYQSAEAYVNAVTALCNAADAVTAYLKGDD